MRRFSRRPRLVPLLRGAMIGGALVFTAPLQAAQVLPYSAQAAEAAAAASRPVVVHVTTTWCTICAAQTAVMKSLLTEPAFSDLTVLRIDLEKQPKEAASFGVTERSVIIATRGGRERARAIGVIEPDQIRALMQAANGR